MSKLSGYLNVSNTVFNILDNMIEL